MKTLPTLSFAILSTVIPQMAFAVTELNVDATKPEPSIKSGHFTMGASKSLDGSTLEANNRFILKDGKPWLPLMGEFHFTRVPRAEWEQEILKMKTAGIDIVATYVFWNHHEETPGNFNWADDHDLRAFTALLAKHKMKMFLRIGPWAHGEARFGGTPDWIVNQMPTRRNDPTYLIYVEKFWAEIAKQVQGYYWKDGGPIIGTQLENEYNWAGPGMGAEHISTLKKMAVKLGFDTPFYTVTGWDGAIYPRGEVVPVFGGYPDEPWGKGTTKMAPNEVYTFRFNSRVAGDAGAQTPATTKGTAVEDLDSTPFLGAEFGPGVPIMYRRRPFMQPDDIGAMLPVQLGSGVNLYGYYMFHGGRNPKAQGPNIEESALLGAWNDCPMINYDFQAPFGQYGQKHPVLNKILPYHHFIRNFGDRLAPMAVHGPEKEPENRFDMKTPRFSVRSKGDSGFVFMSNHVRQYAMQPQQDIRFNLALPGKNLQFPSTPITIPTGAYFVWPFNFDLDGVNLAWATAQPLARMETSPNEVTYVFMAENGIAPELAFSTEANIQVKAGVNKQVSGLQLVSNIKPSTKEAIKINSGAKTISLVIVSRAFGETLYAGELGGKQRLISSPDEVLLSPSELEIHGKLSNQFQLGIFPPLAQKPQANLAVTSGKNGIFQTFKAAAPKKNLVATFTKTREAQKVGALTTGGAAGVAIQPYPENYGKSAAWQINIPQNALDGVNDLFMNIDYQGDIGRLFSEVTMLDDDFYSGRTWEISLARFADKLAKPLTLTVYPLRKDAPIYIDENIKAKLPATDQIAEVISVKLQPEYKLVLKP